MKIYPTSLNETFLLVSVLVISVVSPSHAQVNTSITSDGTLGTEVTQSGNTYDIFGGTRSGTNGGNLFHSFGEFSVGEGDLANFRNDAPALATDNIIGRVTGGDVSNVYGTIQSTEFAGANLFLMNPSGWVFGPNAAFNVDGSVSITTADYIRQGETELFFADPETGSTFFVESPEAFGFLSKNPQGITVDQSGLNVSPGENLSLVGGDIDISSGKVTASGGQITMVSMGGKGEVATTNAPNFFVNAEELGDLDLTGNSEISVDGEVGGNIVIRSGHLTMSESKISSNATGSAEPSVPEQMQAGEIDVRVRGNVILENQSLIRANVLGGENDSGNVNLQVDGNLEIRDGRFDPTNPIFFITDFTGLQTVALGGSGNAGDIRVKADSISLKTDLIGVQSFTLSAGNTGNISVTTNEVTANGTGFFGGLITAGTLGEGNGGNVEINVGGGDVLLDNSQITAIAFGSGDGGNVRLNANNLTLQNEAVIQSGNGGTGSTGGTTITLSGDLEITSGAFIGSLVDNNAAASGGGAGDLVIDAKNILISGIQDAIDPLDEFTGIRTRSGSQTESGGNAIINAENILLKDNGLIRSASTGSEKAGDIILNVKDSITLEKGGKVLANAESSGDAGNIILKANTLEIKNEAEISSRSSSEASDAGGGGNIELSVNDSLDLNGGSVSTSVVGGANNGGNIIITSGDVKLSNSTLISAESSGLGDAGAVTIEATEGNFQSNNSTVSTSAQQAEGGNIAISSSQNVTLTDSTISAESAGPENAGDITVTAGNDITMVSSTISTESQNASGGNIKLNAPGIIQLTGSQITSSVFGSEGTRGGNITLDPEFIILQDSQILARAIQGDGGNILLTATDGILIGPNSVLDASSETGLDGNTDVRAPFVVLATIISQLPKNFVIPKSLFAEPCAAIAGGQFSSFTQEGSGGLPPTPGSFLTSPLILPMLPGPSSAGTALQASDLPQLRVGIDRRLNFSGLPLLPASGCTA